MQIFNFDTTQRITHILMLKSKYMKDPGLLHGQMGVVLSLAHYYRNTSMDIYEEFMNELLDVLMDNIYKELSINFDKGLSGIGWGIEYLLQNHFVEGLSLEICKELDTKLMQIDPKRIVDLSLETGIEGILHYVLAHVQGTILQQSKLPFDEIYLKDLYVAVNNIPSVNIQPTLKEAVQSYNDLYLTRKIGVYKFNILSFIHLFNLKRNLLQYPLGLKDGLSGILIKRIHNI